MQDKVSDALLVEEDSADEVLLSEKSAPPAVLSDVASEMHTLLTLDLLTLFVLAEEYT